MNQSKLTVLLNVQLVNQIINLLMNSTNNQTQCQLEAKDVLPTQTARRPPKGPKNSVFVPGDLDLNIQARLSEEPNTSFLRIWRKSVQRFPRYFTQQNKCSAVAEMGDRLATIDMGRKLGGCAPFARRELDPHVTQCGLGRGLPSY